MKRIEYDPPQAFQYPTSIYVRFVLHTTYEEYLCEEDRLQQSSRGHSGEMTHRLTLRVTLPPVSSNTPSQLISLANTGQF